MKPLSIDGFLRMPGDEVLQRYMCAQVANALLCCGSFSLVASLFPRLQLEMLQIESLIALNSWRLTKLPRWLATAVFPTMLLALFSKLVHPAVTNPVGAPLPPTTNVVGRTMAGVMSLLAGARGRGGPEDRSRFTGNWQHLLVLHLTWLPAMSFYRWFSFAPQLRSFFYINGSMDDVTRQLSPQAIFAMDFGCAAVERVITLLRAHVVTRVLKEPVVGTWKMFFRQLTASMCGAMTAYAITTRWPTIPELPLRTKLFSGTVLTVIRLERHLPLLQSLVQSILEQFFDRLFSSWIPLFPYAPPSQVFCAEHLTPEEDALVASIQQKYSLKATHHEGIERIATEAFLNCSVNASRRVAFATVFWASCVIAARDKQEPKQHFLMQYKDQLRRPNHSLEDSIAIRQDSTLLPSGSASVSGTFQDADLCAVCLSKLKPEQDLVEVIHCNHVFHADCISTWLSKGTQCPCCRFDLSAGKEAAEVEHDGGDAQDIERTIVQTIDSLGFRVPHTYDYEEWGVVRKYCCDHGISCNAALSIFRDDTPVIQITYYDLVAAPLLFLLDVYNCTMTFVRSDYIDYT